MFNKCHKCRIYYTTKIGPWLREKSNALLILKERKMYPLRQTLHSTHKLAGSKRRAGSESVKSIEKRRHRIKFHRSADEERR